MEGHGFWEDMSYSKTCLTGGKSNWRTCPTEAHVLQVDHGLGPTHKYFTNY